MHNLLAVKLLAKTITGSFYNLVFNLEFDFSTRVRPVLIVSIMMVITSATILMSVNQILVWLIKNVLIKWVAMFVS